MIPIAEAASVPRPYMLVPISWRPTDSPRNATNVHGLAGDRIHRVDREEAEERCRGTRRAAATSSTTRTWRWPALDLGVAADRQLRVSRAGAAATGAGGSTTVSAAVPETRLRPSAFDR